MSTETGTGTEATTVAERIAVSAGGWLERRFSRRGLLGRAAVVGAALSLSPLDFILRPTTAYASVCGPGASCNDGWTAMCATINNGVNQCPPGSFAGGWWKADNASLCGGGARYYIDCQGECTGCGCGSSNFCAEGCWNCARHCASGTCDERRVCWNVFRYGQCNQQIGCSGPVLCRVISCVPPWHFENCTTDVATDNNTRDHGAPSLPTWSATQQRYRDLGGIGSVLGYEIGAEYAVPGGAAQNCQLGRLYRSSAGTFYVTGAVLAKYLAVDGPDTVGLPVRDQSACPDRIGQFSDFSRDASIYFTPATGGHVVRGPIRDAWIAQGRERSPLGYPVSEPGLSADGQAVFTSFQYGALFAVGTVVTEVDPTFYPAFLRAGEQLLGRPTEVRKAVGDGRGTVQSFVGGTIWQSAAGGARVMYGPIDVAWRQRGGADGRLGYPTTDISAPSTYTRRCRFEHGEMTLDTRHGEVIVTYF